MTAIVVDTSAIVAILGRESAVSLQESGDVAVWEPLDALLVRQDVEIVAHDIALASIARDAVLRFGANDDRR